MTFTEVGALIGALTGAFTVVDRFWVGRPLVSIQRKQPHVRHLTVANGSKHDLLITKIRAWPRWVRVAYSDSMEGIYDSIHGDNAPILLSAGEVPRGLPITITRGELLDAERRDLSPFVIVISWRKTRSIWLPQFPAVIFSSARSLRRLEAAK